MRLMKFFDTYFSEEIAKIIEGATKWWLELARNLIVVGVTQYLGHKSGSTFIYVFSFVTSWAFAGYYVIALALRLAALVKLFGWRKPRLAMTGAILVYMIVAVTVLHYVHIAVDELAAAQAR